MNLDIYEIPNKIKKLLTIYRRQDLAELLGVSTRTIENWTQGRNEPNASAKLIIKQLLSE